MNPNPAPSQTAREPRANVSEPTPAGITSLPRAGPIAYVVAIALGLFSGWVNEAVGDPLLTSLCVLAFSMFMGVWKQQRPWRWMLLVWIGVPLVLGYYHFVAHLPHTRGQVYGAFLQILGASAGAHGGHFMRQMINHVFLKQDE